MTTTENPSILTFTRLAIPAGGVLTTEHARLRATVVLVVPGAAGRLPTYLWTVVTDHSVSGDVIAMAAGYGEGASIACAEAAAYIGARAGSSFDGFTVVDEERG